VAEYQLEPATADAARSGEEGATVPSFTPDGRHLLVGSTTGRLHVLDARTLRPVRPAIQVTANPIEARWPLAALEPSPDKHVVIATSDQAQEVDYLTGKVGAPLDLGVDLPLFTYSPDGRALYAATSGGEVGVLDTTTKKWVSGPTQIESFVGFPSFAPSVAYSLDGSQLATIVQGRAARWDTRSGAFLGAASSGQDISGGALAFSEDGNTLLIAGADGRMLTWSLDPKSWVSAACAIAGRDLTPLEWMAYLPNRAFQRACQP
jgi:WD40 repeat protein